MKTLLLVLLALLFLCGCSSTGVSGTLHIDIDGDGIADVDMTAREAKDWQLSRNAARAASPKCPSCHQPLP